jgi:type IV pilus assembly protein PilA
MKLLNKKGFSLVELLAVIVILSIIALIAYPIIGNTINNSKKKVQKEQYNRILGAAKNWVTANSISANRCITIDELMNGGYLEKGNIEDPVTGGYMNGAFNITWNDGTNQYTYVYYTGTDCTGNKPYESL